MIGYIHHFGILELLINDNANELLNVLILLNTEQNRLIHFIDSFSHYEQLVSRLQNYIIASSVSSDLRMILEWFSMLN